MNRLRVTSLIEIESELPQNRHRHHTEIAYR